MVNLILAAGTQERWNANSYDGIPVIKQLIEIEGEILIERIQRQFPESIVVTRTNDIKRHSAKWFYPEMNEVTIATLFSTRDLWDDWTTVLLGDVDYGEDTIEKIQAQKKDLMFYGGRGEIYCMKFNLRASLSIITAISKIIESPRFEMKYGKLWNLYRELNDIDFRKDLIKDYFTKCPDCRDYDTQKGYIKHARDK